MKPIYGPYTSLGLLLLCCLLATSNLFARGRTVRASFHSNGTESDAASTYPALSSGARYVAFESMGSNLVEGDDNYNSDIFLHDRLNRTTIRVSVSSSGTEADSGSYNCTISGDGVRIAFNSQATNLVSGDNNYTSDVFIRDWLAGQTIRVSVSSAGDEANNGSFGAAISTDGRYVAFFSSATNLVLDDINGSADIFVHDIETGNTSRVSLNAAGVEANSSSQDPAISGDGRYVAFSSNASNLVSGDTNGRRDIFVKDRVTGETTRASISSGGDESDGASDFPAISGNGRYVAFHSDATNLVADDTNSATDVFVHDRQTGVTTRVSVNSAGAQGSNYAVSRDSSISYDGRYVTFMSGANDLVADDTNSAADIFVHDMQTGQTERVSVSTAGIQGNLSCGYSPSISPDGRSVAFASLAGNLVEGDSNFTQDIFIHLASVDSDFDDDSISDITVWRPSTGVWYVLLSGSPGFYTATLWGLPEDIPAPGDFDGDGKLDITVWRPSTGVWYVLLSGTPGSYTATQWGLSDDIPAPGDFDGDGKFDITVWRPSTGAWYVLPSNSPGIYTYCQWGVASDIPVRGDFDGDGSTDIAVWRPAEGLWFVLPSNAPGTYTRTEWGMLYDSPVSGDFDGDGNIDIAVWRPSNGRWYILPSSAPGSFTETQWGESTDVPVSPLAITIQSFF